MRNHLGTNFTVWKRRHSWFWLVLDQHDAGGTIGTAATEAEAVREACSSIEERAAHQQRSSSALGPRRGTASVEMWRKLYPCTPLGWMDWWMSVAHEMSDKLLSR